MEQIIDTIKIFLKNNDILDINYNNIIKSIIHKESHRYWSVKNKKTLMLIQLYQPLEMRREVFLGSLLFNSFLGQCSKYYLEKEFKENFCPVVSDLTSHYYLVLSEKPLSYIKKIIWDGLVETLPELYFSQESIPEKGILGRQKTRLSGYYNCNTLPFPITIVPKEWARKLECSVRNYLKENLKKKDLLNKRLNNILANITFFYSTDANERQSPALFLCRLVTKHEILSAKDLAEALNFNKGYNFNNKGAKEEVKKRLTEEKNLLYKEKMYQLLINLINAFNKEINQSGKWITPDLLNNNKFISLTHEEILNELVRETTLAGEAINNKIKPIGDRPVCRMCGTRPATIEGEIIIGNDNYLKFHNHSFSRYKEKLCINCAFYAYPHLGFAGTSKPVKGWIPKQENLLFFYSDISDEKLKELNKDTIQKEIKKWQKSEQNQSEQDEIAVDDLILDEVSTEVKNFIKIKKVSDIYIFRVGIGKTPLCVVMLPNPFNIDQKKFQSNSYILLHLILWIRKMNNNQGTFFFNTLPELKEDLNEKVFINNRPIDIEKAEQQLIYLKRIVNKFSKLRRKDKLKYKLHLTDILAEKPLEMFSHLLRENYTKISLKEKAELTNLVFKLEEGANEF